MGPARTRVDGVGTGTRPGTRRRAPRRVIVVRCCRCMCAHVAAGNEGCTFAVDRCGQAIAGVASGDIPAWAAAALAQPSARGDCSVTAITALHLVEGWACRKRP